MLFLVLVVRDMVFNVVEFSVMGCFRREEVVRFKLVEERCGLFFFCYFV